MHTIDSQNPARARLESDLEESRRKILAAIGEPSDATLFCSPGNPGDRLIEAGTRRLLRGLAFREVDASRAARTTGDTAIIVGSGGWCRPYQEIMPALLDIVEERFRRVVVLPSSFDVSAPAVRRALAESRAAVFAREPESYRQIRDLCRAELAHDGAFFFDFSPYEGEGSGRLDCFRSDPESSGWIPRPVGNDDLSARCNSLDEWLWQIARFREIRTDRAHVMIAGALLGKKIEYAATVYHKIPSIAEYALAGFDVSPMPIREQPCPRQPSPEPAADLVGRMRLFAEGRAPEPRSPAGNGEPRLTIVILSWNRVERTEAAIRSLREFVRIPYRLLVIDNNSDAPTPSRLEEAARSAPGFELVLLDRNLGCSGGRRFALERVRTEYLAYLDNDVEVFPGSIEHLVAALDDHPEALAVGASVVLPDGKIQWCGGEYSESGGILRHELLGEGLAFDDPAVGPSGPCRWVAGGATAYRTSAFAANPLDHAMSAYYEDIEWCYRVNQSSPGRFRRCAEALILHHNIPKVAARPDFAHSLPYVEAIARFYSVHGLVLDGLFGFLPELVRADGTRDQAAARLLLELVSSRGTHWAMLQFLGGGLTPLFDGGFPEALADARRELSEVHGSRLWRLAQAYWSVRRGLRRMLRRTRR